MYKTIYNIQKQSLLYHTYLCFVGNSCLIILYTQPQVQIIFIKLYVIYFTSVISQKLHVTIKSLSSVYKLI